MKPSNPGESSSTETKFPRRFGPYALVTHLGDGGMGRVHLALMRERKGDKLCVIKSLGSAWGRFSPEQVLENQERFRREAEISMALDHPGIARTYSSVQDGNDSYLVQEFVDGTTLEGLVIAVDGEQRHIPVALAAYVVAQIAGALGYVHDFRSLGLVHRDLTPANVMLSYAGEVKVIDFGIAKATLGDDTLTKPHIVVGKPLWTAPEVALGERPDRRADLYALGLLFWHMLAGRNPAEHLAQGTSPLPPASMFNLEVPAAVDQIVQKAIQVKPEHRFQSAAELLQAVAPLIPAGFAGPAELKKLLTRYRGPRQAEFLAAMVNRARPLLAAGDLTAPYRSFGRRRVWLALAVATGVVAMSAGTFHLVRTWIQPARTLAPPAESPAATPPAVPDSSAPVAQPAPPSPATLPPMATQPPATSPPSQPSLPQTSTQHSTLRLQRLPTEPARPTAKNVVVSPQAADETVEQLLTSAMDELDSSELAHALALAQQAAERGAGARAYVIIGRVLAIKHDPAGAQAAFEHALQLSPNNAEAARRLERLRRKAPDDSP